MQFVAICDMRASRRQAVKAMADAKYGNRDCAMYRDMLEVLGPPDIDAVLIATGDRWHAMASILAAKAGKDIYSEKPCGDHHRPVPGPGRHDAALRAGCFRRAPSGGASRNFQAAVQLAHSGKLGKLRTAARLDLQSPGPPRLAAGRARAAQGRGRLGPAGWGLAPGGRTIMPMLTAVAGLFRFRFGRPRCSTGAAIPWISANGPTRPTKPCPVEYEPTAHDSRPAMPTA